MENNSKQVVLYLEKNGIDLFEFSQCMGCSFSALEKWMHPEDNPADTLFNKEFAKQISCFLKSEEIKANILHMEPVEITPLKFIEDQILYAREEICFRCITGESGIGKRTAFLYCEEKLDDERQLFPGFNDN